MYVHVILDPIKKSQDTKWILKNKIDSTLTPEDQNKIDEQIKVAGFFILLSREDIAEKEILPSYYERQSIEQIFGFAKHNNNILPLRVHSEQSIKGYLMLVFFALILFITMRQKLTMPMNKVLLTLRGLKAKIFGDHVIVQEMNRKTKNIIDSLGIIMPTNAGI